VVIDLSADFRIHNALLFSKAYGSYPPCPEYLDQAVYGLTEVYREQVKNGDIIANPGCYPTATLLPLAPFLEKGWIGGRIVVNALSGISGAGKKLKENLLFCERTENTGAYAAGKTHRHVTEIQQEVDLLSAPEKAEQQHDVLFTPHLVPLKRGLAITTTVELNTDLETSALLSLFEEYYRDCPFIKLLPESYPQSRSVWGSNRCDIGWHMEGNSLLLFSTIDNLVKGASGQAVQNMNVRFGIDEQAGLATEGAL
jgi:N-acetyl-gamma-glutamyl-phosphate reductase